MSLKTLSGAALAAILAAGSVAAATSPADTIKARQENYKAIGKAFKAVRDELKNPTPSIAVMQASGKTLDDLAPKLPSWFPAGTGPEAGVKTEALPVIWTKGDDFKAAAAKFASAAHAFNVAAQSGNIDAVKAAVPALGGSCKGCHDTFKAKDEH
jgi:cytochrome c556